jgi:hypothetical protein
MAELKDKVQKVLSENRTLVLGAQILLGFRWFQYQAVFRPKFEDLPPFSKSLEAIAPAVLLMIILCLITPSSLESIRNHGTRISSMVLACTVLRLIELERPLSDRPSHWLPHSSSCPPRCRSL